MGYGNNYRRGGRGAVTIKDPNAPATEPQLAKIAELMDERDVDEAQASIILSAQENGLLKGRASGYIGLLLTYDDKPSAEVLELKAQLAAAQALLAS